MKTLKFLLSICFITISIGLNAQSDSTKTKNSCYLPTKGDFAIGADATPIFNYVGNIFNNTANNKFDLSSPLIYAKYYLTDMTALRAIMGVNTINKSQSFYAIDDAAQLANPLSNAQVTDIQKDITTGHYLSLGYQQFVGKKRLRGFYGGQIFTLYNIKKSDYSYGNPMSALNPTPTSHFSYSAGERKLNEVTERSLALGIGGIAGFEYYIFPKVCIGGEVSLNLVYKQTRQLYSQSEKMVNDKLVSVDKAVSPGGHEIDFQSMSFTPNTFQQAGLYVMFHF